MHLGLTLRYWSSLRYSFLRTLFLLADDLRRPSWEYNALSLLSNMLNIMHLDKGQQVLARAERVACEGEQ